MATDMVGIPLQVDGPIGLEVPQATWTTVEIWSNNAIYFRKYAKIHCLMEGKLGSGFNKEQKAQLQSMQVYYRLYIITLTTKLNKLYNTKDMVTFLERWISVGKDDRGHRAYHNLTRCGGYEPIYKNRLSATRIISAFAPKLKLLAQMVHDICWTSPPISTPIRISTRPRCTPAALATGNWCPVRGRVGGWSVGG